MINCGDSVKMKNHEWMVHGIVRRINWSGQAEVEWDGPTKTIRMHELSELERIDYCKETLNAIYKQIPQLQNRVQVLVDGHWAISKPIASPELTLRSRIRNAWLVLTGRAFAVKWY